MLSLNKFFGDPDVVAFTSSGPIDFTLNPEQPSLTDLQKDYLQKIMGSFTAQLNLFRQVHGKEVLLLNDEHRLKSQRLPLADGAITTQRGLPLAVRTADCLPVFIFDPQSKAIGLIHAGWRGTQEQIVPHAIRTIVEKWQAQPANFRIVFGPAIKSCCYEVGPEFQDIFPKETFEKGNSIFFDLSLANKNQLLALGIPDANIQDCGICTSCDRNFFSYRRDKEKSGRMISVLMLKPDNKGHR